MNKQRCVRRANRKNALETKVIYDSGLKLDDYVDESVKMNVKKNRSCYFSPDVKDFGQLTKSSFVKEHKNIQHSDLLQESKEIGNSIQNQAKQTLEPTFFDQRSLNLEINLSKDDHSLNAEDYTGSITSNQNVQSTDDKPESDNLPLKDISISSEPRVKIIAEKFSRYKKNAIEVRKLEQRIVCIEYDVYIIHRDNLGPVQVLRAYFAVSPESSMKYNTSSIAANDDFKADKGIEIIDAKIGQHRQYLEDLKRLLKKKQVKEHRSTTLLTPISLYRMAKKNLLSDDISYTGLLSKEELDEIKELILNKTASSVQGINRRKIRPERDINNKQPDSEDILTEEIFKYM